MSFLSSLFGIFGGSRQQGQVVQSSKLPEEIAPFAKEVLEEAKKQYAASQEAGYTPYGGKTIADLTQEERDAMSGIKGLVGLSRPLQEEALGITRGLGEKFTADTAAEYMSPYQRAVTDIEKREAQKTFERDIMPRFEQQAVEAGGMSGMGSRAAIQASQLGQAQMQQMGDIESRGLQQAYMNAQQQFAQQKARERTQAADLFAAGPAMLQSGLREQGALQTVGEQKRALEQSKLDEAYYKFLEKQAYPKEKLAEYSGFVYGNPLMQERVRTSTSTQPRPSLGRQLLGLAGTGVGIYGMGGGFKPSGFSWGNIGQGNWANLANFGAKQFPRKEGGSVGGLSSLPVVYRQQNGIVGSTSGVGVRKQIRKHPTARIWEREKAAIDTAERIRRDEPVPGINASDLGIGQQGILAARVQADKIAADADADADADAAAAAKKKLSAATADAAADKVAADAAAKKADVILNLGLEAAALRPASIDEIDEPGRPEGDESKFKEPTDTSSTLNMLANLERIYNTERGIITTHRDSLKTIQTDLKTARQEDLKNTISRATRENETRFWMGVVNTFTRLGGTTENIFNIIRQEAGDYFTNFMELDKEITEKTGKEKVDALKTKAEFLRKDIELGSKLMTSEANRIKAISAWIKANAKDAKTAKHFLNLTKEFYNALKTRTHHLSKGSSLHGQYMAIAQSIGLPLLASGKMGLAETMKIIEDTIQNHPQYKDIANKIGSNLGLSTPPVNSSSTAQSQTTASKLKAVKADAILKAVK